MPIDGVTSTASQCVMPDAEPVTETLAASSEPLDQVDDVCIPAPPPECLYSEPGSTSEDLAQQVWCDRVAAHVAAPPPTGTSDDPAAREAALARQLVKVVVTSAGSSGATSAARALRALPPEIRDQQVSFLLENHPDRTLALLRDLRAADPGAATVLQDSIARQFRLGEHAPGNNLTQQQAFVDAAILLDGAGASDVRAWAKDMLADARRECTTALAPRPCPDAGLLDRYLARLDHPGQHRTEALFRQRPRELATELEVLARTDKDAAVATMKVIEPQLRPDDDATTRFLQAVARLEGPAAVAVKANVAVVLAQRAEGATALGDDPDWALGHIGRLAADPPVAERLMHQRPDDGLNVMAVLARLAPATAEKAIASCVENDARSYAAAVGRGDRQRAVDVANHMGHLIGQTERILKEALPHDRDTRILILAAILKATGKAVLDLVPGGEVAAVVGERALAAARTAAKECHGAATDFGTRAVTEGWGDDRLAREFSQRMLDLSLEAYHQVTDPQGLLRYQVPDQDPRRLAYLDERARYMEQVDQAFAAGLEGRR